MPVSSRATSSGSNIRMSVRRGRASSATAQPAPPAVAASSTHPARRTPATYPTGSPPASPCAGCPVVRENGPVLLAEVAETSVAVAASSARLAKVERLAASPRRLEPGGAPPAVPSPSGALPQRQIGVGGAALRDAPAPAPAPSLSVTEVDAAFE